MKTIIEFEVSTRVIGHFVAEEPNPRMPYYQVEIWPDKRHVSPSGEFVRFNYTRAYEYCPHCRAELGEGEPVSELQGWIRSEDFVIDEILEEYIDGRWVEPVINQAIKSGN